MSKYSGLFDASPPTTFAPGTTVPQPFVDEAASRLAQEPRTKYSGLFDDSGPSVTPAPDLPPDLNGAGLPSQYQHTLDNEGDSDDLHRAMDATRQAQDAIGLLTQPLRENWKSPQPTAPDGMDNDQAAAIRATLDARQDMGLLTKPLRENWQTAEADPSLGDLHARMRGIPTARDILALRQAQGTIPADAKAPDYPDFRPIINSALDKASEIGNYVAPGLLPQLDNSLSQFQVPKESVRRFIADAGHQFGGDAIENMLPDKVRTADAGLTDAAAEGVSGLTTPDNIKILGSLALLPEVGIGGLVHRIVSLGFGAQSALGMAEAIKQASSEKDPQEFWKQIGTAAVQGAIAKAATTHGLGGMAKGVEQNDSRPYPVSDGEVDQAPVTDNSGVPASAPSVPSAFESAANDVARRTSEATSGVGSQADAQLGAPGLSPAEGSGTLLDYARRKGVVLLPDEATEKPTTEASDAPAKLLSPSPTKTSETFLGGSEPAERSTDVPGTFDKTSSPVSRIEPEQDTGTTGSSKDQSIPGAKDDENAPSLIEAEGSPAFAEMARSLLANPDPVPKGRHWTVVSREQYKEHRFTDFAEADTYMRHDAFPGERLIESAPGEKNTTLPYLISTEQTRNRGQWTQTALEHFVKTGEITAEQARDAGLSRPEPAKAVAAPSVAAENLSPIAAKLRAELPVAAQPASPLNSIAETRSSALHAIENVSADKAQRQFIADLGEQARQSLGPGAASSAEFPLLRAENAREYATIGAGHLLEGKADRASWTAAMREEYGVRDASPRELGKIWRDSHAFLSDFDAAQRGKPLRPKAQIEQATGIRPALASIKSQMSDAVTRAQALNGYLRGMEKGGKLGAAAREKQLAFADKWLAADQEQVRQTLTQFVNKTLPLSERGRYLGAITRALRRPDLVKGDPATLYRNAFRVMRAIDARSEIVHRGNLLTDIRKMAKRILDSPSVDVAAKRILQRTLREINLRTPGPARLESLGKTREYIKRMNAAGHNVVMPHRVMEALEEMGRRSVADLPTTALEDLHTKTRLAEKIGRARFKTRGQKWDAERQMRLDEIKAGPGTPLELREEFRAQPGERLSFADKLRNWTARRFNSATAFDLGHLPVDVHFDLLAGGRGTYAGPLFEHVRNPIDAAYDRAQYRAIGELEPLREIIQANKLNDTDEDLIGLWAQLQQEGGEKRALESGVTKATIDKLKAKGLTAGQQEAYSYMRARLDATLPEVQSLMHDLFNIDVEAVPNYFPWMRDWDRYKPPVEQPVFDARTGAQVSPEMLESFGRLAGDYAPRDTPKLPRGFTIDRVEGAKTPIRTDSFDVFQRHMYAAARLVEMQRDLKMAGEIIRDPDFAKKFGGYGQKMLNEWLTAVATDGRGSNVHRMPLLDWARRGSSRALVFFRLTSNIKHLSAVPQAVVNAGGPEYYFRGLHGMFSKDGASFLRQFPQVTERQAGDMSLQELQRSMGNPPSGFFPKGLALADRFGFVLGKEIDALNSRAVFLGRYLHNLEDKGIKTGLSGPLDQSAASNALVFMRRTVSSTLAKDVQPVLGRGQGFGGNVSLARTMNAFRQYALERWSLLRYDTPAAFKSGNYTRGIALLSAALAAGLYETNIGSALRQAGSLLTGGSPADNKEHESWLHRLTVDGFSMVPYANNAVAAVQWGQSGIPLVDNFIGAGKAAKRVASAKSEEAKKSATVGAVGAAATLGGFPGAGVLTAAAKKTLNNKPTGPRNIDQAVDLDAIMRRRAMQAELLRAR